MHGLHATDHRQQTSSNLSGPFSTARAVTVGVTWIAMQLHTPAWQALVRSWLVDVRMESNHPSPLSAFVRIWVNHPPPSLWTSFKDDPKAYKQLFISDVPHDIANHVTDVINWSVLNTANSGGGRRQSTAKLKWE